MKLALGVFFLFCFSHSSQAAVAVGDSVTYVGIQNGEPFTLHSFIVAKAAGKDWIVHSTEKYLGHVKESEDASTVISTSTLHDILANCTVDYEGSLESVTVQAGTFLTCKMQRPGIPTAWIGDVPFGLVKYENHEVLHDGQGNSVNLDTIGELQSYHRANP